MKKTLLYGVIMILSCGFALGQQYKVLYSFGGMPNDGVAGGHIVLDRAGNLYGTTFLGGLYDGGTVFELSSNSDGSWSETILYSFCSAFTGSCPDGSTPQCDLVIDRSGNVYGSTFNGGLNNEGVLFELSPSPIPTGSWNYVVLYNFCSDGGCLDGAEPRGPLTFDNSGNLYGATASGGQNSGGAVFELSPGADGWTETVLYSFCSILQGGYCLDGVGPDFGVTFDRYGNLYGTTQAGGSTGAQAAGAAFKLSPSSTGWTESVLATFKARATFQGHTAYPGMVAIDSEGNLYTTLEQGGIYGKDGISYGSVDRLARDGRESAFLFNGTDGDSPTPAVVINAGGGKLYGTTSNGGATGNYNDGNIYQISEAGQESLLYKFCQESNCVDGLYPSELTQDKAGKLYGTTLEGGTYGAGVVFEFTP